MKKLILMFLSTLIVCTTFISTVMADAVAFEETVEVTNEETLDVATYSNTMDMVEDNKLEEEQIIEDKVELNEENFPDLNLLNYLKDKYVDVENEGEKTTYYFNNADYIMIPEEYKDNVIYDLTGLEKLTSVKSLVISTFGEVGMIYDFSEFKNLEVLTINFINRFFDECVSVIPPKEIKELYCNVPCSYTVYIKMIHVNLDVRECTSLEKLHCSNVNVTELDLSNCTKLRFLNCSNTRITELDLSNCTKLECLSCDHTSLTKLDLSNCTLLRQLISFRSSIAELDVSKCTALEYLDCRDTDIKELDLSNCTKLRFLACTNTRIKNLDVSNCTLLS